MTEDRKKERVLISGIRLLSSVVCLLTSVLRLLIWLYRHSLSAFMGRNCRFLPTCSAYADEAIRIHGPVQGTNLAIRRFCRCHPWGGNGFDPVPESIQGSALGIQGKAYKK